MQSIYDFSNVNFSSMKIVITVFLQIIFKLGLNKYS